MFNFVLEEIFWELAWKQKYGITIDGEKLNNLRFADDISLITDNLGESRVMLTEFNEASRKAGLSINTEKTGPLSNRVNRIIITLELDGMKIYEVKEIVLFGPNLIV